MASAFWATSAGRRQSVHLLTYSAALIGAVGGAGDPPDAPRHRIGVWYLWGNVLILSTAIQEVGYASFVILIPRIIHDVTA